MPTTVSTRCAREQDKNVNGKLHHFFLCDSCTAEWEKTPFSGTKAIEYGNLFDGYCRACSQPKQVKLRSWFLCEICKNVASSIGKSLVSEGAIVAWWKKASVSFPHLELYRNDVAALRARSKTDKSASSNLDFLIRDAKTKVALMGIEIKTGPGSAEEFDRFQLDVSDCASILNQMEALKIPAFMMHVQVQERWDRLPSVGFEAKGMWWTDLYTMTQHAFDHFSRADEKRPALYFKPAMFKPIADFPAAIFSAGAHPLVERYKTDGQPKLLEVAEQIRLAKQQKAAEKAAAKEKAPAKPKATPKPKKKA